MKLRAVYLLIAAAIVALPLACSDGNIYSTLENEVEEPDLSLPNDVIVFDVARLGVSYSAAAGKIWSVPAATLDAGGGWDVNQLIPAPTASALCTALVASPFATNTLYGGFITPSGALGLYESSAAPSPSFAGASLIGGTGTKLDGAQIALLKVVDHATEKLAAVVTVQPSAGADYEFWLVTADSGGFSDLGITRGAGEQLKPINDVLYSVTQTAWYATEGANLYSGPSGGPLTRVSALDALVTAGEVLYGLFEFGTNVYVSSWDRNKEAECAVYYYDGSWHRVVVPAEDDGTHPPLTRFTGLTGTTSGILLVGSDGYGYYTLPTSPTVGALTRFATTTSDLYPAAVRKFALDAGESRVFAITALSGLWRGAYDADGSISWTQE